MYLSLCYFLLFIQYEYMQKARNTKWFAYHQIQVNFHFFKQKVVKLCLLHHVLTTIQLIFINREIKKYINLSLWWDSNPQSLCFEATEHLRNEYCQKRL